MKDLEYFDPKEKSEAKFKSSTMYMLDQFLGNRYDWDEPRKDKVRQRIEQGFAPGGVLSQPRKPKAVQPSAVRTE